MTRKHVRPHLDIEVREEENNECVTSLSLSLSLPLPLPLPPLPSPPQGVLAPITDLHYNYHTGDNQNTDTK